jgi:hypothetical protein
MSWAPLDASVRASHVRPPARRRTRAARLHYVLDIAAPPAVPKPPTPGAAAEKTDAFRDPIAELFVRYPDITAQRVFEILTEEGFDGGKAGQERPPRLPCGRSSAATPEPTPLLPRSRVDDLHSVEVQAVRLDRIAYGEAMRSRDDRTRPERRRKRALVGAVRLRATFDITDDLGGTFTKISGQRGDISKVEGAEDASHHARRSYGPDLPT